MFPRYSFKSHSVVIKMHSTFMSSGFRILGFKQRICTNLSDALYPNNVFVFSAFAYSYLVPVSFLTFFQPYFAFLLFPLGLLFLFLADRKVFCACFVGSNICNRQCILFFTKFLFWPVVNARVSFLLCIDFALC